MSAIVVDPELAKQYARVKNISIEEAYKRLEENMVKEAVEVDLRQQCQVLMNAFRKMSPQLQGAVLRESETLHMIKQQAIEIAVLRRNIEEMGERLEKERHIYEQSLKVLNNIVTHDATLMARIEALENKKNIFARTLDKIKCLLKR